MMTPEAAARFNLLVVNEFFDAGAREAILADLRSAPSGPATVYRGAASDVVDAGMRRAARIVPRTATAELVRRRLLERKAEVEAHFGVTLSDCEEPQFLRYGVGDYFVAHQDGNTGLLKFDADRVRRVSVSIFLSRQSETPAPDAYGGGALVFHHLGAGREKPPLYLGGEPGMLVAFRPETTHEVIPVTHGERYSIACWYR